MSRSLLLTFKKLLLIADVLPLQLTDSYLNQSKLMTSYAALRTIYKIYTRALVRGAFRVCSRSRPQNGYRLTACEIHLRYRTRKPHSLTAIHILSLYYKATQHGTYSECDVDLLTLSDLHNRTFKMCKFFICSHRVINILTTAILRTEHPAHHSNNRVSV